MPCTLGSPINDRTFGTVPTSGKPKSGKVRGLLPGFLVCFWDKKGPARGAPGCFGLGPQGEVGLADASRMSWNLSVFTIVLGRPSSCPVQSSFVCFSRRALAITLTEDRAI